MKICTKCKQSKSLDSFHKNSRFKDGLQYQCKPCKSKSYKSPEAKERSRIQAKIWNRKKWSGFTDEEFNNKLAEQNNKCAICKEENPNHADHNHITKQKRGILCKKCNTAIAYFKEDTDVILGAINYLNHYSR